MMALYSDAIGINKDGSSMFMESFRNLIEILALKKENLKNISAIASEDKRISDLEERREKIAAHNEDLKIEEKNLNLEFLQKKIEDLALKLNKLKTQMTMAQTLQEENAFKNQISSLENEIQKSEEIYFKNLERSDAIWELIKENDLFYSGSKRTLVEIKEEAILNKKKEHLILAQRNERINSLFSFCHPQLTNLYFQLEKNPSLKTPVSYLVDKRCSACFVTVDSILESSLNQGRSLETCPSCGRLLIPESAKIY